VRVHTDHAAEAANARLRSHAYTVGEHIATTDPTNVGLMAHEVAHVVQQRIGMTSESTEAESEAAKADRGLPAGALAQSSARMTAGATAPVTSIQLAPNRAGTTDPSYVVGWVRTRESAGGSASEIMTALSKDHGGNTNRYFYSDTYGWVDVRHFGAAASMAARAGSVVTEALGLGNEMVQWATDWGDDCRSGFSPEDIPSNAAGAEFGDDYIGSRSGESVADALDRWMTANGARPASDPRAGRASLPTTDPSERGGAGRGSSNVSRTQSTVSGAASAERASAEQSAAQLVDPMNWMRMYGY
jgi:Domain of unknown function (DUF4157)